MSQEGKGARVEVRWMLGREENGKELGERREWERMEKHRKDRKIGNSDFIDSVGSTLYMLSGICVV